MATTDVILNDKDLDLVGEFQIHLTAPAIFVKAAGVNLSEVKALLINDAMLTMENHGFTSFETQSLSVPQILPENALSGRVEIGLAAEIAQVRTELVFVRQLLFEVAMPVIESLSKQVQELKKGK